MIVSNLAPKLILDKNQINYLLSIKNYLHQNPETSWQEFKTTTFMQKELSSIPGLEFLPISLNTGIVARIKGGSSGKCVALRADLDAIELNEAWESDYKSKNPGKAHACGHDFHSTALLGAAKLLAEYKNFWKGSVVLIFQPAEETTNGAKELIKLGIFEKYNISAIFGLHNRPEIPTGNVVIKTEPLMAAKKNFSITIRGKGGHGSMPHKCIDPILCAAALAQAILTIPSRNIDPMKELVLSICSIHGGTPNNLIVDTVEMTGSMRYLDPSVGERALQRLTTLIHCTAVGYECTAEFNIVESVPPVINHPNLLPIANLAAQTAIGPNAAINSESCLATEDFAEYLQVIPGFFYWIGSQKPNEAVYSWHNDKFHTDDNALPLAAQLLAHSALHYLQN